ncbi:MAG: DUF2974 domain-containing protein [Bacilli bacterium]|nr:DUF2974 domain-containing protein [Bacilli bacterium]
MNIIDYVNKYGNFDFNEEEFNDIDNVILSLVSYVDFSGIVSKERREIRLQDAANRYFETYTQKEINENIFSIKSAIRLFEHIKDFKRYKDIKLYNYVYEGNSYKQFSAITMKLNDQLIYIAFEGTDELISGWKEDFELAYLYPIPSQVDAINYINKVIKFKDKKVIVGGHSKGGNLAVTAAMNCNILLRNKIIKVYSNDGPGLLDEELNSVKFKRIKSKYIHIMPNYSIVGILLGNVNDEVIKSSKKGILAHDALNWEVEDTHFISTTLDESSKSLKNIFEKWLEEYGFEQRMICVNELFELFEKNEIYTLIDIRKKGLQFVLSIIKSSKEFDETAKEMFKQLFTSIYNDYTIKLKEKIGFNK